MANSNKVISAPVAQYDDARAVTQNTEKGIIALCQSGLINKYSKCKPQAVAVDGSAEPKFFADQTAREEAYKKGCWGLTNIPFFNDASRMVRWMLGDTTVKPTNTTASPVDSWSWRKPIYNRHVDFNKYNQNAMPMVQVGTPAGGLAVPYAGTNYFKYPMPSDGYSITVADMCQAGVMLPYNTAQHTNVVDPAQLRCGLCIIYGDKSSYTAALMINDRYANEEGNPLTFPVTARDFKRYFSQAGDYKAFVFLGTFFTATPDISVSSEESSIMPMAAVPGTTEAIRGTLYPVNGITGIFYPVPTSLSSGRITINLDPTTAITASIYAVAYPQTPRYVTIAYNVLNKETQSFVYVTVKIELYSGETLYQTAWPEGTSRIYLAGQGSLYKSEYNVAPTGAMANVISSVRLVVDIYESTTATSPLGTVTKTATVSSEAIPLPDVN